MILANSEQGLSKSPVRAIEKTFFALATFSAWTTFFDFPLVEMPRMQSL